MKPWGALPSIIGRDARVLPLDLMACGGLMHEERAFALLEHATYVPTSANEVLVKGGALEGFTLLVEDPEKRGLAADLIRAIGSGATETQLLEALVHSSTTGDQLSSDELLAVMDMLVENGAVKEFPASNLVPESSWAAFVRFGELPSADQLAEVTVLCSGDAEPVLATARALGAPLRVVSPRDIDWSIISETAAIDDLSASATILVRRETPLVVHLAVDGARGEGLRVNEQAVSTGVAVLHVTVDGVDIRIGPYVVPGRSACLWEVERQWARASADRPQYETLLRFRDGGRSSRSMPLVGLSAGASALAPWLLELALRRTSTLAGEVIHGRATTGATSRHSVMRLPRCPICLPLQPMLRNPLY